MAEKIRHLNWSVVAGLWFVLLAPAAAQLNWEGQTGGLITPFAYSSASSMKLGRPEMAFHYLDGGPVLGSDFQLSVTVGFLKIAEGGFTRTFNIRGSATEARQFENGFNTAHIKFRLLPENAWSTRFVPAVAAGAIVRTQVRRVSEVNERENTTATDFFFVGTKTVGVPSGLSFTVNLGGKITNASMFGIAANSPVWVLKPLGGVFVGLKAPYHSRLSLGVEFNAQAHQWKEVPGTAVPATLGYLARWHPGSDVPLSFDVGMMQLGGNVGSGLQLQARHQLVLGVGYRF